MTATALRAAQPARARRPPRLSVLAARLMLVAVATVLAGNPIGRMVIFGAYCWAGYRWSATRLLLAYWAATLCVENASARPFRGLWVSPVNDLGHVWFDNISTSVPGVPLRVSPVLLFGVVLLARCALRRTGERWTLERRPTHLPPRFGQSLMLSLVAVAVWSAFGIAMGGDTQQLYYQASPFVLVTAILGAAACLYTPALESSVGRILIYAAAYRAVLALYLYITRVRHLPELPTYVTTHTDSVLWVVAIILLVVRLLHSPTSRNRANLVLLAPVFGLATVVNNRRLAWVTLAVALVYVLFATRGVVRNQLSRIAPVLAPLLAVYALAGFVTPDSTVFAPVQSLRSVLLGDDNSSKTRDIENFNLVFTMRNGLPTGTGFGHPYIELVKADDISQFFEQYVYLPHNSVLGLLMWAGPIGFALILLPVVYAGRSSHRLRRTSQASLQHAGFMGVVAMIAYFLQGWGDLGLQATEMVVLVGVLGGLASGALGGELHNRATTRPR